MTTTTNATVSKKQQEIDTSSSFHYEFGGPYGAAAIVIILPVVVLLLAHWSHVGHVDISFVHDVIASWNPNHNFWMNVSKSSVLCPGCNSYTTTIWISPSIFTKVVSIPDVCVCMGILLGWFVFQVLLERYLPCEIVEGVPIVNHPNKIQLSYRINGHLAFWFTMLLLTCGWPTYHAPSQTWQLQSFPYWSWIYRNFPQLAFASSILCYMLSIYLYWSSFQRDRTTNTSKVLAVGGNSGNRIYDFYMGRELNPRTFSFDWKEFCELRPGLIGWVLLNISCAHEQYMVNGSISGSTYLLLFFQGMYVWDALYQEKAILSTMDITTDGFGFMLVFGDLCWVPFTYSIQARYLVHHDPHLTSWQLCIIVAIYIMGYAIFRCANGQKDTFRRNPNDASVSHLKFLSTRRGTKLLTSGWWGMARKINYTGDYIMGLSWCLLCGYDSIVPYYYAIYFAILLLHRSQRDDNLCYEKYGDDWDTYKQLVPYRFIPGVV